MSTKDNYINPIVILDRWTMGMCISNKEIKELEEYLRRVNNNEHIWVKYELINRNIEPYKDIKVWDVNKFKYIVKEE